MMTSAHLYRRAFLAIGFMLCGAGAAADSDHEQALRAFKQGEVRPLVEIIAAVEGDIGGNVIEIEFERDDGRYVYELKVLTPTGRLRKVYVDAASARILKSEDD